MTMIEERAYQYAVKNGKPFSWFFDLEKSYITGATEQDRIARQEERERCIKVAIKVHCELCGKDADYKCYCLDCLQRDKIRKALEGGEG